MTKLGTLLDTEVTFAVAYIANTPLSLKIFITSDKLFTRVSVALI